MSTQSTNETNSANTVASIVSPSHAHKLKQHLDSPPPLSPSQQVRAMGITWLTLDALFLLGNALHFQFDGPGEPEHYLLSEMTWNGDYDGSYIEILGHIQLVAALVWLMFVGIRRHVLVYWAWSLVLFAITFDDFMQIHERWGERVARAFDFPAIAGLRPDDLGEMMMWATAALLLCPFLLMSHLRAPKYARRDSWVMVILVILLAGFGVVVDQLHIMVTSDLSAVGNATWGFIETSGELLAMTLLLLAAHRMAVYPSSVSRSRA